ncbi:transposase, partial [Paenibacillus sp. 203]|uniref:transposase n=1 Tax=Paenibacillus sp. 203 TaxID=3096765 RepID=UPI003FA6FE3E
MLDTTNNGGAVFLPKFSLDEKLEAIRRYQRGTEGVKSIAQSLGMNHEALRMWI